MSYDREEWQRPWRVDDTPQPTDPPADDRSSAFAPPGSATGARRPGGDGDLAAEHSAAVAMPRVTTPQAPATALTGASVPTYAPGEPDAPAHPDAPAPGSAPAPAPPQRRGWRLVLAVTIGAVLGAGIGTAATLAILADQADPEAAIPQSAPVDPPPPVIEGDGSTVPEVAAAVTPSVVRIDVSPPGGSPGPGDGGAIGSGVIYRPDGYVLTNHHVIQAAIDSDLTVSVRLASGDVIDAEIVGSDPLNDLAVIRVERNGLPAIDVRPDTEPLQVGETVIAIGSPFGLDASVTAGIVSALNREIRVDEMVGAGMVIPSVIQTDAAINPGNSGGALVDARGRLVGINTAILTRSGASQGVGFAVSYEQAISSADQLIELGFVRHPLLGVTGVDVTPDVAEQFGLPASRGAVVESVQPDTGAADAGLHPGDIIIEIDGEPLATMSQLVAEVRARAPGDTVVLGIVRDGDTVDVEVELGERPRD